MLVKSVKRLRSEILGENSLNDTRIVCPATDPPLLGLLLPYLTSPGAIRSPSIMLLNIHGLSLCSSARWPTTSSSPPVHAHTRPFLGEGHVYGLPQREGHERKGDASQQQIYKEKFWGSSHFRSVDKNVRVLAVLSMRLAIFVGDHRRAAALSVLRTRYSTGLRVGIWEHHEFLFLWDAYLAQSSIKQQNTWRWVLWVRVARILMRETPVSAT